MCLDQLEYLETTSLPRNNSICDAYKAIYFCFDVITVYFDVITDYFYVITGYSFVITGYSDVIAAYFGVKITYFCKLNSLRFLMSAFYQIAECPIHTSLGKQKCSWRIAVRNTPIKSKSICKCWRTESMFS